MTIGEKIRSARIDKHMTQAEVADDKITRNMLSAIEGDKATPSLDTLYHIANKLEVPIAYLLSDDSELSHYRKNEMISDIKSSFKDKKYSECISLIDAVGMIDDELAYILAYSHFELGLTSAKLGAFITADKHLASAKRYSEMTMYDTKSIECRIPLYSAFVKNVNSPLLDFDKDAFYGMMIDTVDYEFFKYMCNDVEYQYENVLFKRHLAAKLKIRQRKYFEAIDILLEIAESRSAFEYNAYLLYGVYGDLDNCYKQICDFENAYKYSGKRLSMLEGFNS